VAAAVTYQTSAQVGTKLTSGSARLPMLVATPHSLSTLSSTSLDIVHCVMPLRRTSNEKNKRLLFALAVKPESKIGV